MEINIVVIDWLVTSIFSSEIYNTLSSLLYPQILSDQRGKAYRLFTDI